LKASLIDVAPGLTGNDNDRVNPPAYDTFAISNYVRVPFKQRVFHARRVSGAFLLVGTGIARAIRARAGGRRTIKRTINVNAIIAFNRAFVAIID